MVTTHFLARIHDIKTLQMVAIIIKDFIFDILWKLRKFYEVLSIMVIG